MESPIQSSFIPSDTVQAAKPVRSYYGSGAGDLFVLLALVLFVTSVALGAGVFLYKQYLTRAIEGKTEQLQRAKEAFEPALIVQLTRLDDRMRAGQKILDEHVAPSQILLLLEQSTLQSIAFRNFSFLAEDRAKMALKMQGVAQSVNAIALQADYLGKSGVLSSPIFSNITRQSDGIHFDLTAIVNPQAIRYVQTVGISQTGAAASGASSIDAFGTPSQ